MFMPLLATAAAITGSAFAAPVSISGLPGVTGPAPYRVTGNITLSSGTDYLLDEEIYVDGGTLTIQPGVMIAAEGDGALIVCRGSQIFAEGTAEEPIVFTSLDEYNHLTDPVTYPFAPEIGDNGQWGGVIILGRAPINFYVAGNPFTGSATGNTNVGENQVEGVASGADTDGDGYGDLLEYGQDNALDGSNLVVVTPADPEDNSGVFKFVSIRFGGKVLGLDNEINGLTMGGVGRGTTIEHVEVVNNTDDGFEWFGGTVNCKYLVSAFNEDEDFDIDEGYSGKIQFAFALRYDDVDGAGNVENGSELDGGNGSLKTGFPLTSAQIWNATYLGAGRVGSVAAKGNVFRMKDNFAGQFHNCLFDDFGGNLVRIDDADTANRVGIELLIQNSHWGRFNGLVAEGQTAAATALANGTGNTDPAAQTDPLLRGISRLPDGQLDPRPAEGSPLYGSSLSTPPAGLEAVNYRGAFGSTNWASDWTYLDAAGYFGDLAGTQPVAVSSLPGVTGPAPFRITGDVTLIQGVDYLLDEEIYVDGGTLTIQPGVMIAAEGDGALIVCRGSQIFAEGTAEEPIVFTSLDEYNHLTDPVTYPFAPEIGDNGQWGGVIILGRAPINFYVAGNPFTGSATGNTNVGENQVEGVASGADTDGDGYGDLLEYGQDNALDGSNLVVVTPADPEDNSGVFKFVSIRFGGKVLGLDNEINGLTMGGVGRGTTIEHVEVVNNTDDGFEWFGGTVNCKYLVSAFNEDEDFDIDEGYSGKIQFAFALRYDDVDGAGNVENGSELDGGNGSLKTGFPLTSAQIWNATYLGAGRVGSVAAKGNVFRMKDNFAGQFHNCLFDDFGGNLVRIDDADTANRVGIELLIQNSHWGRFNGLVAEGQTAAATALANGTGNTDPAAQTDPLLGGISRLPNGGLDPRPNATSPLYGSSLSTPPAGLEAVSYRGAFGSTNWASDWTYLDAAGYFGDLATVPVDPGGGEPPFADVDNDGISDTLETSPALQALGFSVGTDDSALFASLFTETSILDLRTVGQAIVQAGASDVLLSLPVEKSAGLDTWENAGNLELTIPKEGDKEFYRISVTGAE